MASEVLLASKNARCPLCRRDFKSGTTILRLHCHHSVHLHCFKGGTHCTVCSEPVEEIAYDSDDEEARGSRIEGLFAAGTSLHDIKNSAIASTAEALRDLGLRRAHFVRYPELATGPALARYSGLTATTLLAYFGITARDAPAMFTDEQRRSFGYRC